MAEGDGVQAVMVERREVHPCFVCGGAEDQGSYTGDHTSFDGSPGYGSRFDGTGRLRIFVCDDCLEARRDRVVVVRVRRVEPEVTLTRWECETCGALAYGGRCEVEHGVACLDDYPLGSGDDPDEGERFMLGVGDEGRAREFLERYRRHARERGLEGVEFRARPESEGRWVVYAVGASS